MTRRSILLATLSFAFAMFLPGRGTAHAKGSKCKYCGSTAFGQCQRSPHKKHEHGDDIGNKCVFCGSTAYGNCSISPTKKHRHGASGGKCAYCGSTALGRCSISPHGNHERV